MILKKNNLNTVKTHMNTKMMFCHVSWLSPSTRRMAELLLPNINFPQSRVGFQFYSLDTLDPWKDFRGSTNNEDLNCLKNSSVDFIYFFYIVVPRKMSLKIFFTIQPDNICQWNMYSMLQGLEILSPTGHACMKCEWREGWCQLQHSVMGGPLGSRMWQWALLGHTDKTGVHFYVGRIWTMKSDLLGLLFPYLYDEWIEKDDPCLSSYCQLSTELFLGLKHTAAYLFLLYTFSHLDNWKCYIWCESMN